MFDCYIALFEFKSRKRVEQVYVIVLDNDAFVRHSINGLNTVCRICHLEVILSDFNVFGRYLYHFSHFGADNAPYELLKWYLQKRFRHNTSYLPPRNDSKAKVWLDGNFIYPQR